MNGGSLSDQQLKEFDAYLSGENNNSNDKPADTKFEPIGSPPAKPIGGNDLDDIVRAHERKIDIIMGLLDKVDAKAHKDIVADLVDEMQYQKSIVKREKEQGANLKRLISLANEAVK